MSRLLRRSSVPGRPSGTQRCLKMLVSGWLSDVTPHLTHSHVYGLFCGIVPSLTIVTGNADKTVSWVNSGK